MIKIIDLQSHEATNTNTNPRFTLRHHKSSVIDEIYRFTSYDSIEETATYLQNEKKYMFIDPAPYDLKYFIYTNNMFQRCVIITCVLTNLFNMEIKRNHQHEFTVLVFPPSSYDIYESCVIHYNDIYDGTHTIVHLNKLTKWTGILVPIGCKYNITTVDNKSCVHLIRIILSTSTQSFFDRINYNKTQKIVDMDDFDDFNIKKTNAENTTSQLFDDHGDY